MIKTINGEAPFQVLASNFSIGPTNDGYTLQISADGANYSDLFSVGAGVTRLVTSVANGSYYRLKNNTGDAVINWRTQCSDGEGGGGGSTYILPPATTSTLGGVKIGNGITVQADGTISAEGGSGVVYVSHLSDAAAAAAPVGTLIVLNNETATSSEHMIYIKVEGGEVAYWDGYNSAQQEEPFKIIYDDYDDFVDFADGKSLLSFKYTYGSIYRYIAVDKEEGAVILYSDETLTTEITRATYLGSEVEFVVAEGTTRKIYVHWKENEINFRPTAYVSTTGLLSFATEGVHYHRITDPTKATAQDLGLGTGFAQGIPEWNNEGVIVRNTGSVGTSLRKINTTGYGSSISFYTSTNTGSQSWYIPTMGGTVGQVLTSNGDAEPIWATMIKAVQITSAAYEALAVKDPNTLYLIVD